MKQFLTEDRNASTDKGCLMAMVDKEYAAPLNRFGDKLIPESQLYKVGSEFGREKECHCTIRYGFFPDLNELQLRRVLEIAKPFIITITGIDKFENPKEGFDVVKFTVESPVLRQLNAYTKQFPNEDKYPTYRAHMTIAYVKPDSFTKVVTGMNIQIPIRRICYSPAKGEKSYYDL
jgi:2'-5' RNA ligase